MSADVEDFEYTPRPEFEGNFTVFNEPNEVGIYSAIFMSLLPLGGASGCQRHCVFMLSIHTSVCLFAFSFLWCLWYALTDFYQTFVNNLSWHKDGLVSFWVQKIKGQGHIMTSCAKNTIFGVRFCNISRIHCCFFSKLLRLATKMNWFSFWVKGQRSREEQAGAYRARRFALVYNHVVIILQFWLDICINFYFYFLAPCGFRGPCVLSL